MDVSNFSTAAGRGRRAAAGTPGRRGARGTCAGPRPRLAAMAILLLATTVFVSGCTIVQRFTGKPTEQTKELSESALDNVLLTERAINDIANTSDLTVTATFEDLSDDADSLSDTECAGALFTSQETAYAGSGWTTVREEELENDSGTVTYQTAVLFRTADRARDFVDASGRQWSDCANSSIARTIGDDDEQTIDWEFGDFSSDPILTLPSDPEGANTCQHAMAVYSNLVMESTVCGRRITDEAAQLVNQMLQNAADEAGTT